MKKREFEKIKEFGNDHFWYKHKKQILKYFYSYYFGKSKSSVIDAGCGTGIDADVFEDALGMDIDWNAFNENEYKNSTVGDINNFPFKSRSFDLLISMDVIQHKNVNNVNVLNEFHRVLNKNGMVFLNIPALPFMYSNHDHAVSTKARFSRTGIKRILNGKFSIEKCLYWNSLLLPLVIVKRKVLDVIVGNPDNSDIDYIPFPINRIFEFVMNIEMRLSKMGILPFGLSLFIVLRKK